MNIYPKSDDTRWRLQQLGLYAGGTVVVGVAQFLAFAINIEERTSPYIAYFRAFWVELVAAGVVLSAYKLIKWARVVRIAEARQRDVSADNATLAKTLFDLSMQAAKMSPPPQAASGNETAKMFVNQTPSGGVHLDAQVQQVTADQALAEIKAKEASMSLAEYTTLMAEFGSKKSPEWAKVRTALLSIRKKKVEKGLWEVSRTVEF